MMKKLLYALMLLGLVANGATKLSAKGDLYAYDDAEGTDDGTDADAGGTDDATDADAGGTDPEPEPGFDEE